MAIHDSKNNRHRHRHPEPPSTVFTNLRYPLRKVTSLADRPIVQLLLDRPLPLMLPTAA